MSKLHEEFRLPTRKVLLTALTLVLIPVVAGCILFFWIKYLRGNLPGETSPSPPSPRLQVEFEAGLLSRKAKAHQLRELQKYDWVDSQREFAKVPIERAMEALRETASIGGTK